MFRKLSGILILTVFLLGVTACNAPKEDASLGTADDLAPITKDEQEPIEEKVDATPSEPTDSDGMETAPIFEIEAQKTITVKTNRLKEAEAYPLSLEDKERLIRLLNQGERKESVPLLEADLLLNLDGALWHYDTAEGLAFGGISDAHVAFDAKTTKEINEILLAQVKEEVESVDPSIAAINFCKVHYREAFDQFVFQKVESYASTGWTVTYASRYGKGGFIIGPTVLINVDPQGNATLDSSTEDYSDFNLRLLEGVTAASVYDPIEQPLRTRLGDQLKELERSDLRLACQGDAYGLTFTFHYHLNDPNAGCHEESYFYNLTEKTYQEQVE